MKLPYFICLGTYRAGTTWLQSMMQEHHEVFLPFEKETMFFSHFYDRGIDWYLKFFNENKGLVPGEICPTYLADHRAPKRIYKHIPDSRLIVLLRSPVEQIFSLYKLWLMRGYTKDPLRIVIRSEAEFLKNVHYYQNISRFLDYFDRSQILILCFEDMKNDSQGFLNTITDYLGISKFVPTTMNKRINASGTPVLTFVDNTLAKIGDYMRKNDLYSLKQLIGRTGVVDMIKSFNRGRGESVTIEKDVAGYIIQELKEDIDQLSILIDRDLSNWIAPWEIG